MQTETSTPSPAADNEPRFSDTIVVADMFDSEGRLKERELFKYNTVTGGVYLFRRSLFDAIAKLSTEQVMQLDRKVRNTIFALLKQEASRYYGTAVRKQDNATTGAKAGDPLPKLTFKSGAAAVGYRESLKKASARMREAVFPESAQPSAQPEQAAA